MPSPIIHLQIAERSSKSIVVENESQFFLGCISPDAIHMGKNNNREYKRLLHLTTIDKNILTRIFNGLENYNKIKETFQDVSFLQGMYSHIITDHLWSHLISRYYLHHLYENTPMDIVNTKYYQEEIAVENEIVKLPNSGKIITILKKSNCIDYIDLLTEYEVSKWKERTIAIYSRAAAETIRDSAISDEIMEKFMNISIEVLLLFFANEPKKLKKYLKENCEEHSLMK